jgi:sugar-specific transcriptional regulator TrmB
MAERLSTHLRESLGLNLHAAQVYLAALELGSGSITQLAKKARIPRTSAYSSVEHLLERGFLLEFRKGKQMLYVPAAPEKLLERLHEQESRLQQALPALSRLAERRRIEPQIRVIPGEEGIRTVLREILADKRPFRAMVAVADLRVLMADYFEGFIQKRAHARLRVHLLTNRTPYSLHLKTSDAAQFRATRFFGDADTFHTATYIFGDKVAWISIQDDPPMTVIMEDDGIAKTHAMTFDQLWEQADRA